MRFLLAALPLFLLGIDPISPGDAVLDPSLIPSGVDSLVATVHQGDQAAFAGLVVLTTRTAGGGAITRAERFVGMDGTEVAVDSFALDLRTLAPTYRVVAGTERTDPGEAFHPNSVDIVLAALPLAEGYSAELAMEAEGSGPAPGAEVRVLGTEDIRLPSGEACPSWEVEVVVGERLGVYYIGVGGRELTRHYSPLEGLILTRVRGCTTG